MFIFLSVPATSSVRWAHSRYSTNTGAGATITGNQPVLSPKGLNLCLQAQGKVERQHHFPHSPAHTTFFVFLPGGGGAGSRPSVQSCWMAQQLYRMLTCSPRLAPELPHIAASSCTGVSLVASALLLLLQEVAERGSVNPSGVSSSRERRGRSFPLHVGTDLN